TLRGNVMKRRKSTNGSPKKEGHSKALLDKKAEKTITQKESSQGDTKPVSAPEEKREYKPISALDKLRKSRDQGFVEQETSFYQQHVLLDDDFEDDDLLFTTQNLYMESTSQEQLQIVQSALKPGENEEPEEKEEVVVEEKKEKPKKKEKKVKEKKVKEKKVKEKKVKEKKVKEKKEKPVKEKKKKEKKTKEKKGLFGKKKKKDDTLLSREEMDEIFPVEKKVEEGPHIKGRKEKVKKPWTLQKKITVSFVVLLFLLLGVYSYVVLIRNPQINPTPEQAQLYDKLVEYADEWDMLSDTEKNELIDIEEDYEHLLSVQKNKINEYYKEQTGSTLKEIYVDLNKKLNEEKDETNAPYRVLMDFLNSWENLTDNQKMGVITYKNTFDSIPPSLQSKVNQFTKEKIGMSFNTIYRQYNEAYVAEMNSIPVMYPVYKNQLRAEYQKELDELQEQYLTLSTKETSLQEQKKKLAENDKKYKTLMADMEYNEANLAQTQLLIDLFSQIVEQYDAIESSIYF
ncbi:MAG: hypothetical protein KBT48_09985, partial [Firmicutes bacterium]|nr:hypothetical protein [Bacillota bacterium]